MDEFFFKGTTEIIDIIIHLLPQTAVLSGLYAGSNVVKPASSFVIQNCQTSCSVWCSSKLRLRKGHPLWARHKQDWDRGFIFLLPQAAVLDYPNQILAMVVLSQHRVLPYKTFRPHATCDAQCMGHIIRTWFAFFLMAH